MFVFSLFVFQCLTTDDPLERDAKMAWQRTSRIVFGIPALHLSLTCASLGLGLYGNEDKLLLYGEESFDAKHYDFVTELVTKMYAGRGLKHDHCHLAKTITFEDPAAICKSPAEINEAFRALQFLKPKSISYPKCVHVEPLGSSIALTYALHQQYSFLSSIVDLRSLLVVEVELIQRKDVPESDFLVTRFEERWYGIPPQNIPLFWMTKRLNGILSWNVTKWIR